MSAIVSPVAPKPTTLPLENGDRLTRTEFERRYKALPYVKKTELIEGIILMPSPLRAESHAKPHAAITTWLGVYAASTVGVGCFDNATVRLDPDNEFQPDALLRLEQSGQSRISEHDYIEGAPELVVKSPPAALLLTCMKNSRSIAAINFRNISYGAFTTANWTGSS